MFDPFLLPTPKPLNGSPLNKKYPSSIQDVLGNIKHKKSNIKHKNRLPNVTLGNKRPVSIPHRTVLKSRDIAVSNCYTNWLSKFQNIWDDEIRAMSCLYYVLMKYVYGYNKSKRNT